MAEREFTAKDRAAFIAFYTWLERQSDLKGMQRRILGMLGAAEIMHQRGDIELGANNEDTFARLRSRVVDAMDDDDDLRGHQPTPLLLIPPKSAEKSAEKTPEKPAAKSPAKKPLKKAAGHVEAAGKKGKEKKKPPAFAIEMDEPMLDLKNDFESWLFDIAGSTLTDAELSKGGNAQYDNVMDAYIAALAGVVRNKGSVAHAGALEKARAVLIAEIEPRIKKTADKVAFKEQLPNFERDAKEGKKRDNDLDNGPDDSFIRDLLGPGR